MMHPIGFYKQPVAASGPIPILLMKVSGSSFVDASPNAYTLTPSSNVVVSTDAPFAGQKSFGVSAGNIGRIIIGTSGVNFNPGVGDFTMASWIKSPLNQSDNIIFSRIFSGNNYLLLQFNSSGALTLFAGHNATPRVILSSAGGVISANTWTHVAAVKMGDIFSLYKGGERVATTTVTGVNLNNSSTQNPAIGGASHDTWGQNNGLIFDCSVWSTALYSGASYAVPTAPY